MKSIIRIILLLFSCNLISQIKIEWSLNKDMKNADIIIFNEGNESIAFPINNASLQAYFSDSQKITKGNWSKDHPFFALTLNIYDNKTWDRVETELSLPYWGDMSYEKKVTSISNQKEYDVKIKNWQNRNKIKQKFIAEINYYIMSKLIFMKPKEIIRFSVVFNLRNITNQENEIEYFYLLEKEKKYTAQLTFDVDKAVYGFLTQDQKKALKKYRLFTGKVESNKIELEQ
ncbi:hypothetical protein PFY12_00650 [Chryseobacterium camelliae]|uniref:Uncharacterized protein n=1 Tax=Chryseobacterium camelliae TaxID=1265445 RepID=A0ABY7QPJ4_9FLAO|nr:hypothetical protein [Chryseobacterium camelliae]WBV60641.1 hypothetical protein PFY12_00650 [Chryseobacterium camelliae]